MRKIKTKRIVAIMIIALFSITLLAGCEAGNQDTTMASNNAKNVITIGYLPITHALAVFEAKELLEQSDSEVKIELQKFSSWTDLTDALNAGKIDGASMLVELAMNAVSQGIDLKAVGLGHRDGNVIVVSNEITSNSQLKGKTFAIPSTQSSHNILLQEMLEEAGLTIDDVTITQLSPSEMPSSLASGAIDGYCVAEPFGAQAVVNEVGHVLYDSKQLWEDSICCAFVLRGEVIEEQKDVVGQLIETYYTAGEKLTSDKALELATKYLGQQEETLKESLQWISFNDLKITKEEYESLVEKVKEDGINEAPPAYETFVYEPEE